MYVIGKWFRGGVTNFYNFYAFLQKCRFDSSMFRKYSRYFCGIFSLTKMPDILFLSSNKDNFSRVLVKEAFT
jgi:ribosomal protein S2